MKNPTKYYPPPSSVPQHGAHIRYVLIDLYPLAMECYAYEVAEYLGISRADLERMLTKAGVQWPSWWLENKNDGWRWTNGLWIQIESSHLFRAPKVVETLRTTTLSQDEATVELFKRANGKSARSTIRLVRKMSTLVPPEMNELFTVCEALYDLMNPKRIL